MQRHASTVLEGGEGFSEQMNAATWRKSRLTFKHALNHFTLKGTLSGNRNMLVVTAAAGTKIGTRSKGAVGRGDNNGLKNSSAKILVLLGHLHKHLLSRNSAADKNLALISTRLLRATNDLSSMG